MAATTLARATSAVEMQVGPLDRSVFKKIEPYIAMIVDAFSCKSCIQQGLEYLDIIHVQQTPQMHDSWATLSHEQSFFDVSLSVYLLHGLVDASFPWSSAAGA